MRRMTFREKYYSTKAFLGTIKFIFMAFPMYLLSKVINTGGKYDDLWIISERHDEARDNGYHFFKYIRSVQQKNNCYYVIDRNSADLSKVLSFGNIIYFGSYKHYLFYYLAKKHISTHGAGYGLMPDRHACRLMEKVFNVRAKNIYLKHGIVYNFIPGLTKKRSGIDLFICGAFPEFEFIKSSFGYDQNEVQYLGMPRFDSLLTSKPTSNQIMFMPTWRRWLLRLNDKEFQESTYYKRIQSLINSGKLNDLLLRHNILLKFCLHPRFHKFRHLFYTNNSNVKVLSREADIQEVLKESVLLITDYSSVFFDFGYMKKPVIYYHFDYKRFKHHHYQQGYFNYEHHGFGPLVGEEEELFMALEENINNNFSITEMYNKRINRFFPIIDKDNSERIFEHIANL